MVELTGIVNTSPIGFMAALGLLRVLNADCGLEVRLGWHGSHAVMEGVPAKYLIPLLETHMAGRSAAPEFTWTDSPRKATPAEYREACKSMVGDDRALGFMAGWASDAVIRNGFVSGTRMDMTSGQQKLLKNLRDLAGCMTGQHFERGIFGGAYENQSSFGLDPIAVRAHAYENQAPSKTTPPGKPGLIWLAFESIPLHPVVAIGPNSTNTVGWGRNPTGYYWPVWDGLFNLQEVTYIRTLPVERLSERVGAGFSSVWMSQYGSSGKYGMLLPARRER